MHYLRFFNPFSILRRSYIRELFKVAIEGCKLGVATHIRYVRNFFSSLDQLNVVSIKEDCDKDTLLIMVNPVGPVCHTGTDTCWGEKNDEPIMFLSYLQDFIAKRYEEMPEKSYTTSLFQAGINRMAQKVGEEAVETVIEATNGTDDRLIYEASDMIYHLIVLLTSKGMRIEDLATELKKRHK